MTTPITLQNRVVDAIARATFHVKAGNSLPFTISFVADEPYCIVRVKAIRTNTQTGESYAFYQIDGGPLQRMEHSIWADLYHEMVNGTQDLEFEDNGSTHNDYEYNGQRSPKGKTIDTY